MKKYGFICSICNKEQIELMNVHQNDSVFVGGYCVFCKDYTRSIVIIRGKLKHKGGMKKDE